MEEDFKYDVFLSHSSADKPVVRAVAERLRTDGLRVWLDDWELKPGDHLSKIEDGLEHSRVLVLFMSANAFGSDWAKLEADTFRFRDPLNKERRFIPLRLDDAPLKGSLAYFLHIAWRPEGHDEAYAKLLEACRASAKDAGGTDDRDAGTIYQLDHNPNQVIYTYAFSPDGKHAITGSDDRKLRLWDVETGRCLRVFKGHWAPVWSVAWSVEQRRALSGAGDNTVLLWDVETGRCLRDFSGHQGQFFSVAWSGDGRHALSGGNDSVVFLWDVRMDRWVRTLEGHKRGVMRIAWSADGRRALSGAADKTARLWNVKTGQCMGG